MMKLRKRKESNGVKSSYNPEQVNLHECVTPVFAAFVFFLHAKLSLLYYVRRYSFVSKTTMS